MPPTRRRPPPAPGSEAGAILTPAQLRECVTQKERLHAQTDDALKDKAAIEADKAEIARIGTSLDEELDDARPHQRRGGRRLQRQARRSATS